MPELAAIGLPACGPNSWYKHPLTLPRTEQPFEMASGCEHGSVQAKEAYPFLSLHSEPQKVWKKRLPKSRDMTGASSLWFQLEIGVLTGKRSQSHSHRVDGGFCHHWKVVGEKLSSGFLSRDQLGGPVRCCETEGRCPHPLPTEPKSIKKIHYPLANPPPF